MNKELMVLLSNMVMGLEQEDGRCKVLFEFPRLRSRAENSNEGGKFLQRVSEGRSNGLGTCIVK